MAIPSVSVELEVSRSLLDHPSVCDGQIGVVGKSKGGELALLLGSKSSQVGAVVGYIPSGIAWQGMDAVGMVAEGSSWTIDGENVPSASIQFAGTMREMIDWGFVLLRGRPMKHDRVLVWIADHCRVTDFRVDRVHQDGHPLGMKSPMNHWT